MIIGIDASRANLAQRRGTEWYIYYLIQEFKKIADPSDQFILYTREPLTGELAKLPANFTNKVLSWPLKYFWTQLRLSWELMTNPPDVFFSPAHIVPLYTPKNTIITVHDVGFLQFNLSTKLERLYHRLTFNLALKTAKKIIVDSEFTKAEILRLKPLSPNSLRVIPLGVDLGLYRPISDQTAINQVLTKYGVKQPFLLYVGQLEKKKNIINLLKAFHLLTRLPAYQLTSLVLVGSRGYGYEEISKLKTQMSNVVELGYVPESDLPALYNAASALVFISNYEGFGLPALQTMACGTPIIAADSSSLPEVVGEAGLLVDPNDITAISQALSSILTDQNLVSTLKTKGLARVKSYSWLLCAKQTLALLLS